MASSVPEKELADLRGTDDYVVVTAWVTHVQDLNAHKPYQKGILGDDSSWNIDARKFVVWDPDLTLEKGNCYRIFGRERTYERFDEIQLQISDADHVDCLYEG